MIESTKDTKYIMSYGVLYFSWFIHNNDSKLYNNLSEKCVYINQQLFIWDTIILKKRHQKMMYKITSIYFIHPK